MIICGDALTELRKLPDETIHCCVTSPPYWGLRDYGVPGQFGLERTPEEYVAKMVEVFREVRRVLRKDGTLWLNLGDSYATPKEGNTQGTSTSALHYKNPQEDLRQLREESKFKKLLPPGLKPKDLVGIPWRVAFALQADGWWLRQDIIWAKPNPMPESVRDRCTKAHEYIFMLSQSAKYWYDAEAVREPEKTTTNGRCSVRTSGDSTTGDKEHWGIPHERIQVERTYDEVKGANRRSVWTITTKPMPKIFGQEHFATFPPEIPEICIKAGCPIGGIVLDPFFGAGTTGMVAKQLGRDFIGIELNQKYCEMAERQIAQVGYQPGLAMGNA